MQENEADMSLLLQMFVSGTDVKNGRDKEMSDPTLKESCLKCLYGTPYRVAKVTGKLPMKEKLDKRCAECIEIVHKNFEPLEDGGEE